MNILAADKRVKLVSCENAQYASAILSFSLSRSFSPCACVSVLREAETEMDGEKSKGIRVTVCIYAFEINTFV